MDGRKIYVACNKSSEIVEIDAGTWTMSRRWAAGEGVYNLAVSPDGKYLIATNKRGKSISVYDLATTKEVARIPTLKGVVHGVVVSPDARYAFVTEEGRGSEAGILEVFDLASFTSVATLELGQQAGDFGLVALVRPQCRELAFDLGQAAFGDAKLALEVGKLGDPRRGTRQAGSGLQIGVLGSDVKPG